MKRKAKRQYFQKLVVSCKDSRQVWKAINLLTRKHVSRSQQITNISPNNLNNHFSTIVEKIILNDKTKGAGLGHLKKYIDSKDFKSSFMLGPMTTLDVSKGFWVLKQSCTRDRDSLDGRILKLACPVIVETLTYLYNLCIDKKTVSHQSSSELKSFLHINLSTLLIHLITGLHQSYLSCQNLLKNIYINLYVPI